MTLALPMHHLRRLPPSAIVAAARGLERTGRALKSNRGPKKHSLVEQAANDDQTICPEIREGEGVQLAPHADTCTQLGQEPQREAHHCTGPAPRLNQGTNSILQAKPLPLSF